MAETNEWDELSNQARKLNKFLQQVAIFMVGINAHAIRANCLPAYMLQEFDDIEKDIHMAKDFAHNLQEAVVCAKVYDEVLSMVDLIDPDVKLKAAYAYDAKRILKGTD